MCSLEAPLRVAEAKVFLRDWERASGSISPRVAMGVKIGASLMKDTSIVLGNL